MSVVRRATFADLPRLCRTAMHAFATDPVMRWFYPDDDEYYAGDGAVMEPLFRRWLTYDSTFTTDDGVAVAAFIPQTPSAVAEAAPSPENSPHTPERLAKFALIGPLMQANTPPEVHWYLNLLGTHPHWQRQGLGAMVMAPIMETCDRDGLPLYLETETVENVAYYSHHGFTVRSEWDVPLEGPHMWGMIRQPKR